MRPTRPSRSPASGDGIGQGRAAAHHPLQLTVWEKGGDPEETSGDIRDPPAAPAGSIILKAYETSAIPGLEYRDRREKSHYTPHSGAGQR